MISILLVIFLLHQSLSQIIFSSKLELDGLVKIKEVTQAIQLLQRHRDLSTLVKSGQVDIFDKLKQSDEEFNHFLSNLVINLQPLSSTQNQLSNILAAWDLIKLDVNNLNVNENQIAHSRLIKMLLKLEDILSDDRLLTTDSDLDSNHLIMLVTYDLPVLIENNAELRTNILNIVINKKISQEQKIQITILKSKIEDNVNNIEYIIEHTTRYNPNIKSVLYSTSASIANSSKITAIDLLQDVFQENFNKDPNHLLSEMTLASDNIYQQIYESFLPAISQIVQLRIAKSEKTLWLSIGIPVITFLVILYYILGAHLSLRNSITALLLAAKSIAAGNLKIRCGILSQDEIGQVAESFNEVATSFENLLLHREQDKIRLQSIIDTSLDAIVQIDFEGNIISWNHEAESIFGWTATEACEYPIFELITPEISNSLNHEHNIKSIFSLCRENMVRKRFEAVVKHRDGHSFSIEMAITPYQLDQTIEFSAFIRDISQYKLVLSTLASNEKRYRALFESSRDALMTLSPAQGFLSGNSAALKLFACQDEQEFLTHTPASLSPEKQADGNLSTDAAKLRMQEALDNGSAFFLWLHKRTNNETFFAEVTLSKIELDNEIILHASVRDVTERIQFKNALINSEARTRAVLRTMSDGVVLADHLGTMLLVNNGLTELFGYEEEEMLGQNLKLFIPEPHHSKHDGYLSEHLATQKRTIIGRRVEFFGKHKDGSLIPIELAVDELIDDAGITYIGVMRNISDRKSVEQAQEYARIEAERLADAKTGFLANMSHEIRTPLNAIIGLSKRGIREQNESDQPTDFNRIYDASMHLLSLINDILDFSKIEAGKLDVDLHAFQLRVLIDDVVNLLDLRIKEKNLNCIIEKSDNLPEWVRGDSLRIRQILVNLLANAVKFTSLGHIRLGIAKEGEVIHFTVADSGIGMTSEQVQRLFNPFQQADSSTTRKFGGTGLGLAISRNLARIMGGDITVESILGIGSRFTLSIPLPAAEAEPGQVSFSCVDGPRLNGIRVLAAEDVSLNRLVLEDLLHTEGANVVFAENGELVLECLEKFGASAFDVVLMDIQMPVMDGYEATRRLKKIAPELPVIGLTAHAMAEERQRCLEAGMCAQATKPIITDVLVSTILHSILVNNNESEAVNSQNQVLQNENFVSSADIDKSPAEKVSLIDWPAVQTRFDGRQAFINQLINNTLNGQYQENVIKLRNASEEMDYATIKSIAHNLKGLAGVFDSRALMEIAKTSEISAKNQLEDAFILGKNLAATLENFLQELVEHNKN
jgi:PAS domain S-box-containing protein